MATAVVSSPLMFCSRSEIRQCFAAAVVISNIIVCLLTSATTALPMKDVVGQAVKGAKRDGQQQQQHREKREDDCAYPTDLQLLDMYVLSNLMMNRDFLDTIAKKVDSQDNDTCLAPWGADLSPLADHCPCPHFLRRHPLPSGSYPTSLTSAHCSSPKCLKMAAYGCQKATVIVNFLKPSGCENGTMTYQKVPYKLGVNCVCADGKSLPSTTTSKPGSTTEPWGVD